MLKIHKSYVIDESQQPVAVQVPINEFEQIESALQVIADNNITPDIEKDIVVQMALRSQKQVKLRVKHLGRAKLQVVYDPLPLD